MDIPVGTVAVIHNKQTTNSTYFCNLVLKKNKTKGYVKNLGIDVNIKLTLSI